MNILIEMLIGFLVEWIKGCMAKDIDESNIRTQLLQPGRGDWVRAWLELGNQGIRGRERRAYMEALRDLQTRVTGELIDEVITEAKLGED